MTRTAEEQWYYQQSHSECQHARISSASLSSHHRHHSNLCREDGACTILGENSKRNAGSYEDGDADEHHPCDGLLGLKPWLGSFLFLEGRGIP